MGNQTQRSTAPSAGELELTENAQKVLQARYLKKTESGELAETPAELFRRVARTIAGVERLYGADETQCCAWEDRFYRLMTSLRFMPNSPTLMNAGREMGMLSACFVLPVRDSVVDIFDAIKQTALIQKAGGGTGFAFDELRPTGDFIKSSGGTTSGPISFWRAFSEATNAIQQGAFRRGANMGMMYVHHPDILKFLHAKEDLTQFTNYNISVKLTDTWMQELRAEPDSAHVVRNPRTGRAYVIPKDAQIWKYGIQDLIEVQCVQPVAPGSREAYFATPRLTGPLPEAWRGRVYTKADIWNIIVRNAWQTGEPGIVFIDRINEHNPTPALGRIEATNPCGEQPLLPYEACNLGSINLGVFVRDECTPAASVDWDALRETVWEAVRFLDDVVDANNFPLPEIDRMCKGNRKIGLGVMGFADALFKLGAAYNSEEGVQLGERFMAFIDREAHAASEELARQRGCFTNWSGSVWQVRHNRLMRNAGVTTVAPTGTISIIANCSCGIEPLFGLVFQRDVLRGQRKDDRPLLEVNQVFKKVLQQRGLLSDKLMERVAADGTLARISEIPEDIRRVFVCAHDISPEWHVRMQAAFQRHCDAAISKTINFPNSATLEDVQSIYHLAYELGCKGVTVYRDGCRAGQPMAIKCDNGGDYPDGCGQGCERDRASGAAAQPVGQNAPRSGASADGAAAGTADRVPAAPRKCIEPEDLPEIVSGLRIRQMTPFGNMHVKITVDPRSERELEIFAQLGKGGDVANSDLEAICRVASLWLRAGGSLRHLIKQWEGIGSSLQIPTRSGRIMSLPDGLACALKKYTRAKERFGLRALLLGEIDLAELDNPRPAPHSGAITLSDRAVPAPRSDAATASLGSGVTPTTPTRNNGGRPAGSGADSTPSAAPGLAPTAATGEVEPAPSTPSAQSPAPGPRSNGNRQRSTIGGRLESTIQSAIAELGRRLAGAVQAFELTVGPEPSAQTVGAGIAGALPAGAIGAVAPALAPLTHFHDAAVGYLVKCPQCGGTLARQEGCLKCLSQCGWTAC